MRSAIARLGMLASSLAGCAEKTPEELGVIKLGLLSSFTGQDQRSAQKSRFAAELAVSELNAVAGPLAGTRVELVYGNDQLQGSAGKAELERLLDEGIVALIGPETSRVARDLLALSAEAQLPMVTCCATSDTLTESPGHGARERYFFRTIPTDLFQAPVLSRVIGECGACEQLGVLYVDDPYGRPFAAELEKAFEAAGGEVTVSLPYDPRAASYASQVEALGASRAGCAAVIGLPEEVARIRQDFATYVLEDDWRWFGTDGLVLQTFASDLGDPALADDFLLTAPSFDSAAASSKAFQSVYRGTYRITPDAFNARTYDAAALVLLAVAQAGSTEGPKLRDALFDVSRPEPGDQRVNAEELADGIAAIRAGIGVNYEGASGPVDFNDFGNVRAPYDLFTFSRDGQLKKLGAVRDGQPLTCQ